MGCRKEDDLIICKSDAFDVNLRIEPELSSLNWLIMPKLYSDAKVLHDELCSRRAERSLVTSRDNKLEAVRGRRKKKKHLGLRVTDPW